MRQITERLTEAIKKKNSVVCVGLDPIHEESPDAILKFNKDIIEATHEIAVAFKPQIAFYEKFGASGIEAFKKTIELIHEAGVLAIDDSKRADIGTTSEAYAKAHFEELKADFITVNPYLGTDAVKPFLEYKDKGVFVLCRTSNPSARDLQDQILQNGEPLYMHVAKLINEWGAGAVVGATYPEEAKKLRGVMPNSWWLVPGYGAQGATADMVKACFNEHGTGAIINSARDIIYAYKKTGAQDVKTAARSAATLMRDALNHVRSNV